MIYTDYFSEKLENKYNFYLRVYRRSIDVQFIKKKCSQFAPLETSVIQLHSPFRFSFHKLTLLSPPETARILPMADHETCQITSSNTLRTLKDHVSLVDPSRLLLQMITRRSWEQLAM